MNEIVKVEGDLVLNGFRFTKTGLVVVGKPTYEDWSECGLHISKAEHALTWWIGDWANYGENNYDKFSQKFGEDLWEYQTFKNAKWLCDKIDKSRRRDSLSPSHHSEVVTLDINEQDELLDIAEKEKINVKDFRQVVRNYKHKLELALLPPIDINKFSKQVLQGDCLTRIKEIPDKSVDMIYVDPPYNMGKADWDTFNNYDFEIFTIEWLKQCVRVIKDKAHLFINFDSDKVAWLETIIAKEFGIYPASRLIWHYRNAGGKSSGKFKFSKTYEPILHYCFGEKELNFPQEWDDRRFDVWTIAVPQSNFAEGHDHPTQKPLELLERLVDFGSKQGDLVLDPMAGSGTTGVVCQQLNRQFILIEKNDEYIKQIYKRLSK